MSKLIDLTGQTFGYWKVIKRAPNRHGGHSYWLCKCTVCGKEKEVFGSHLRGGRSTNCGCIRTEKMRQANIKHEEGKDYGFLHVNRMATEEEKPRTDRIGIYWNCTCTKCGRANVIVLGHQLRHGDTKSCGCLKSFNESKICQMLDILNFKYVQQKTFKDLTSTDRNYGRLMFDCAVYNDESLIYVIEYDGIQHFESGHFQRPYESTHQNDLIKNKYCFDNNIPIIRIPYDAEYNANDLKLETTRFLLTPENEKEYYEKRSK